jgi:glutathione S-transferase
VRLLYGYVLMPDGMVNSCFKIKTTPMTIPVLYGNTASRTMRNLWLLEELATPYERVVINYKNKGCHTPEFLAINPNAHIPALVDGDVVMYESLAINLYLARKYGGPLSALTLAEEAQLLKWSFWVVTEVEKDALTVLMHRLAMPAEQRKPELAAQAEGALRKPINILNAHLAHSTYVLGERFTVADINLASICNWVRPAKALLDDNPHFTRWLLACLDREAHKKVQHLKSPTF